MLSINTSEDFFEKGGTLGCLLWVAGFRSGIASLVISKFHEDPHLTAILSSKQNRRRLPDGQLPESAAADTNSGPQPPFRHSLVAAPLYSCRRMKC